MPPSPGKIHSLPVKVLYSIDTSSQSFLTVLHDRQDVYIHPGSPYTSEGGGPVGSCTLKSVARGICFASPECIPNSTSLDFSVYNLDPTVTRPATARAFPSSPAESSSAASSWTGKGFLSWALSENGKGKTLIKGRLVREYEFSSSHFAPEGGLEGLMALASSGANGNGGDGEDSDGKGWGLEVGISLRQLNPDGKIEFQDRKEFEDMLAKGKSTSTSTVPASASTSSPVRPSGSTPARSSPLINGITRFHSHSQSEGGRTPHITSTPQQAGPSASSTATVRPPLPLAQPTPVPAHQAGPSSSRPSSSLSHRASSSSMPPSSLPALPSSSNIPSSRPSSSVGDRPNQTQTGAHPRNGSAPPKPESSNQAGPSRNREVTPPPVARPKSPPPSTPSRSKLHALLRADGMMSPELARHLASNPVLRNLLKAVPSNSNALTALRSITGINRSPTAIALEKGKKSAHNGNGHGNGTGNDHHGHGGGNDGSDDKEGSPEATTPTPSNAPLPTPGRITRNMQADGCCNCGTTVSSCWRTKKMKDGTPRKVCDDCGLYFNEHKRMRPPELWHLPYKPGSSSTATAPSASNTQSHHNQHDTKRKHLPEITDGPASGLRSSPRLNRSNSDKETHTLSSHSHHPHPHSLTHTHSTIPESPRKRQKTKGHGAPPPPSPRRSTRNSAKSENIDFGAEVFGFSPASNGNSGNGSGANSIFGTSPAIPITALDNQQLQQQQQSFGSAMNTIDANTNTNTNGNAIGIQQQEEIDISAFLASFENVTPSDGGSNVNFNAGGNGNGLGEFSMENLFNGIGDGMGIELSQEMQDLLNGWESQLNDPNYMGTLDLSNLGAMGVGDGDGTSTGSNTNTDTNGT
ncbi:uncharacterized protein I303_100119 [Kwoniella dejecticola CBS 10117]|uniref:GATA-type domain-containing protein n=1 Tax=Kwoniella dejecticola CBS 10117 TaxID=1296121 RepID=A0A1A6AE57_9TREE|nr:uncharacterized protein I303_00119 [Kwoniella dejecticola CBS 10117]OBR88308.1 hypothetical protein I303_00119 [Kwoniella dejecticola CBS 10117]